MRTTLSTFGAYTSLSNQETPTSEYNLTSPTLTRLMGKKVAKRKGKGKVGATSSNQLANENAKYLTRNALIKKVVASKELSAKAK